MTWCSKAMASRSSSIPRAWPYLDGTELDFAREGLNEGFKFNNPNVQGPVRLRRVLQRLMDLPWPTCHLRPVRTCSRPSGSTSPTLDSRYRDLQRAGASGPLCRMPAEAERRLAMQWAAHANEAYQTLKKPLERGQVPARACAAHDIAGREQHGDAADFLMEQMELARGSWTRAAGPPTGTGVAAFSAVQGPPMAELESGAHACWDDRRCASGRARAPPDVPRKLAEVAAEDRLDDHLASAGSCP